MTDKLDTLSDRHTAGRRRLTLDAVPVSALPASRVLIDNAARTRALIAASKRATADLKARIARGRQSIAETRELLTTLSAPCAAKRLRGGQRHGAAG